MRWQDPKFKRHNVLALVGVVAYILFGLACNIIASTAHYNDIFVNAVMGLAITAVNIAVYLAIIYSIFVGHSDPEDWGIRLGRRTLVNVGLVIIGTIPIVLSGILVAFSNPLILIQRVMAVGVEELVYRVLVITILLRLIPWKWWRGPLSVVLSSLLFTAVHIPTKDQYELLGIFTSSIFMGTIFLTTGCSLFIIYAHVVANTVSHSGLIGGLIVITTYFILAFSVRRKQNIPLVKEVSNPGFPGL